MAPPSSAATGRYFLIWPRISPAGCFLVWMFTYALPDLIALMAAAKLETPGAFANCLDVSLPLLGSLHGLAQMLMITGPAWPALPEWTCAACAAPVRPVALRV